jgi:hypothetical protein
MDILEKATGQFIDDCGRLRMLTFEVGSNKELVLFTPPLHPLNIKRITDYDVKNNLPKFGCVSAFIQTRKFEIVGYHRGNDVVHVDGVWLRYNLKSTGLSSSYYIPFKPELITDDSNIVDDEPPLWILTKKSYFSNTDKVAEVIMNILKQVTAKLCADMGELPDTASFISKENYIEDILERLSNPLLPSFLYFEDDQNLLYDEELRIYIPKVQKKLKAELIKNLINHASLVLIDLVALQDASQKEIINGSYTSISSFRESSDFCVFETMQEILDYKNVKDGNVYKIQDVPNSNTSNPYILCHPYITGGRVSIIQNAKDVETAGYIVRSWTQSKYNPGFDGPTDELKHTLNHDQEFHFVEETSDSKPASVPDILIYEDGSVAAILNS